MNYDAILLLSFGGPEGMDDIMPFLHNVLRGRNIPEERKKEVAHHYELFDGVSPINQQNRDLIAALRRRFIAHAIDLPIYWGNRNWHPLLTDTMTRMMRDGVKKALYFVTSAFSCYSGCRQYREDIAQAGEALGAAAPSIDKIRVFFNHPGFIEAQTDHIQRAFQNVPESHRSEIPLLFTAHSIPLSMARTSAYEEQLKESCRLTAQRLGHENWRLVYQSRSGPPSQPWLEPDICDELQTWRREGVKYAVVSPIGFISDHMEVLYDLDTEAQAVCDRIGLKMTRAKTVGDHPAFIDMVCELIQERLDGNREKRFWGRLGAWHDVCPEECCRLSSKRYRVRTETSL